MKKKLLTTTTKTTVLHFKKLFLFCWIFFSAIAMLTGIWYFYLQVFRSSSGIVSSSNLGPVWCSLESMSLHWALCVANVLSFITCWQPVAALENKTFSQSFFDLFSLELYWFIYWCLCFDRVSEWTPLWIVNWCQWTLQTHGRWKPLLKSCSEPPLQVPPPPTRKTPSSKPWRTLNGSCRWQNRTNVVVFHFKSK